MTLHGFMVRAIGTPYVAGGREFGGWDCWGLVFVAYREILGRAVSAYGEAMPDNRLAVGRAMKSGTSGDGPFKRVDDPQAMDVVVMRLPSGVRFGHVGLYDGAGGVLHVEMDARTVLEPVNAATIRNRIMGYWRHFE